MPDFTDTWTAFTRTVFLWVASPRVIVPVLAALSALAIMPKVPVQARLLGKGMAVLLSSYLLLATPLVASGLLAGLTWRLPAYDRGSGDVAVVLSRGDELGMNRYDLAIQLWGQEQVPEIFVTSMGRIGYMTNRFKQDNLPLSALHGSTCARTTYEEAVSTAALLQPRRAENIILITDAAHMWRSVLTFQRLGFKVVPYLAPYPPELSSLQRSVLALREYLGLVHYACLGRLAQRLHPDSAASQAFVKAMNLSDCTIPWLSDHSP